MRPDSSGSGQFPLVVRFLPTIRNHTPPPLSQAHLLTRGLKMPDGSISPETALPDLANPDEWPNEPERDPNDANDPENWPAAGEDTDRAAAVLRAAADALDGKRPPGASKRGTMGLAERCRCSCGARAAL